MSFYEYCDTVEHCAGAIEYLSEVVRRLPELYMDMEGVNLGRGGSVSLIQVKTAIRDHPVYIFDCIRVPGAPSMLKALLESEDVTKYLWDPRADADALFHCCGGIRISNVACLQLAEVYYERAICQCERQYVNGLGKVLSRVLDPMTACSVLEIKQHCRALLGVSPAVFGSRPISDTLCHYAAMDVFYLPYLKELFYDMLDDIGRSWVRRETLCRISLAFGDEPLPRGRLAALAP